MSNARPLTRCESKPNKASKATGKRKPSSEKRRDKACEAARKKTRTDQRSDAKRASAPEADRNGIREAIVEAAKNGESIKKRKRSLSDVDGRGKGVSIGTASRRLGVPASDLKQLAKDNGLSPIPSKSGNAKRYLLEDLACLIDTDEYRNVCERRRAQAEAMEMDKRLAKQVIAETKARISDGVVVSVRERLQAPKTAVLYTGPTNSGKTYRAIEDLKRRYEENPDGIYVYAGPLRMLAYEVYEKLAAIYGEELVGFVTGEEQINPSAQIRCCTVEMAPQEGELLILDEAHWMVDDDRGQHWTNLLVGGAYKHFRVITADEAHDAIEELLSDADEIETVRCERMTPLVYGGRIDVKEIPPRTAVVAFSRKSVYSIAREISKSSPLRVGVLYGALPIRVRKEQIERYIAGAYDIMVTTDVIGHGINLPIDNVVFAETSKYDGHRKRRLMVWEAAQIAGRAGRYGYGDAGTVYSLEGIGYASPDQDVARAGVSAGCGATGTDLVSDRAYVTPQLADLRIYEPSELAYALQCWQSKADDALEGRSVKSAPMTDRFELIRAISAYSGAPATPWSQTPGQWHLTLEQLWSLSGAPLDPEGDVLVDIVSWANSGDQEGSDVLEARFISMRASYRAFVAEEKARSEAVMKKCEETYASAQQLTTVFNVFGTLGTLNVEDVEALMDEVEDEMLERLDEASAKEPSGACVLCGAPCEPWHELCDRCYSALRGDRAFAGCYGDIGKARGVRSGKGEKYSWRIGAA